MEQVASIQHLMHTEYYNDFLRPQGIHHQLTISARVEGRVAGVVALFRPRKRTNFTPAEVAKAGLCASYLSGALAKVVLAERSWQLFRAAGTLACNLPCRGVLVVDSRLKVIYRNSLADQLLGPGDGRTLLPPQVIRTCQELADPESPEVQRFLVETDQTAGTIEVMVRRAARIREEPLLVISVDPDGTAGDWMKRLAARGVSRREMVVVHLVGQGLTNREVARRLYISQHTVENHLKAVFRKLAVKNRASLTGLLNSRQ